MNVLRKISFIEVLKSFDDLHPVIEHKNFEGNKWAREIIKQANVDFQDSWVLAELAVEDVINIVLPYHPSEDKKDVLIDERGLRVEEVLSKVKELVEYSTQNPVCWGKIVYWRTHPFTPLFLSTSPASTARQKLLEPSMGKLFHLDGLHRLIGWGLDGRYNEKMKLLAYVAGININHE